MLVVVVVPAVTISVAASYAMLHKSIYFVEIITII